MSDVKIDASSWRNVEVGRVVVLPTGSLAAIVEIIDHKRVCRARSESRSDRMELTLSKQALVDGPSADPKLATARGAITFSNVLISQLSIPKLPRGARSGTVKKAWEKAEVDAKWKETNWAKTRLQQDRRRALTDFDRFKVMRLKKQRRFEEHKALAKIKAAA